MKILHKVRREKDNFTYKGMTFTLMYDLDLINDL